MLSPPESPVAAADSGDTPTNTPNLKQGAGPVTAGAHRGGMTNQTKPNPMPWSNGKRSPQTQAFMDAQWRQEEREAMREASDHDPEGD